MYSKREASHLRKNFWTQLGQYLRPLRNATGERVNWLNYKTGARYIYFRMDAGENEATIAIELRHPDASQQARYFGKFRKFENLMYQTLGEKWQWQLQVIDEDGKPVSCIGTQLQDVNVFNSRDWPAIISFLKPRIIALDAFWNLVKEEFE